MMRLLFLNIAMSLLFIFHFQPHIFEMRFQELEQSSAADSLEKVVTTAILPWESESDTTVTLILPVDRTQVFTATPTFSWAPVMTEDSVEYRLLISNNKGKIVFDNWIGRDTSYTLADFERLPELNTYYWTIYAKEKTRQLQSPIWSFWFDPKNGTDMVVKNVSLKNPQQDWKPGDRFTVEAIVQNSGPEDTGRWFVTLFSGNVNRNYWDYFAYRKTIALDTVAIDSLKVGDSKTVTLTANLPAGFNHIFVSIEPGPGFKELIDLTNFFSGIKIQTENRMVIFHGLFIIYRNYLAPDNIEKKLTSQNLESLYENISRFQQHFWDHTHILYIDVDTLQVNRTLKKGDFTFQDNQWGYFLSPEQIAVDLEQRGITHIDYDFIFVYYSWSNSRSHWSGYSGYTFKDYKILNHHVSFLAQPVIEGKVGDEEITSHEFIHLLHHRLEEGGESTFHSPHQRALVTTFEKDSLYFDWMLETWPTEKWFNLKKAYIVNRQEIIPSHDASAPSFSPNSFMFFQSHPNLFSKNATITYKIPPLTSSAAHVNVSLSIYDLSGNRIRILENELQYTGINRIYWDGRDQDGNEVRSAIYFADLRIGQQHQIRKLVYFR